MTLGLGFNIDEVPSPVSTAPYDLVVGLICFDFVYFPLSAIDKVHALLGSDFFWQLAQAEIIRFVHMQHEPAVMSIEDSVIGDVGLVSITDPSSGKPQTPGYHIGRLLVPAPGRESIAEKLFSDLENKVIVFSEAENIDLAGLVRAS